MITCVIIDDEPKAIELLEDYIHRLPQLQCLATFRNPIKALEYINQEKPALIFLDINMPQLSGLSLAKILPVSVAIIFTTAHSEHAVKSYDMEALDYLLKPIGFERFVKAVNKAQLSISKTEISTTQVKDSLPDIISLKSGYDIYRIPLKDILYLEKDGNYMIYHTLQQKILVRESIADALRRLPAAFMQVHKSYIVALNKINVIEKDGIKINQQLIPIALKYRPLLIDRLT